MLRWDPFRVQYTFHTDNKSAPLTSTYDASSPSSAHDSDAEETQPRGSTRDEMSSEHLKLFHRHDLRKRYLESYWFDREVSGANWSGQVRHSIQKVKCSPHIAKYQKVETLIHELELQGDLAGVAMVLQELDHYLCAMPGSMTRPAFMCNAPDGDVEHVEVDRTPAEILDVENYVEAVVQHRGFLVTGSLKVEPSITCKQECQ